MTMCDPDEARAQRNKALQLRRSMLLRQLAGVRALLTNIVREGQDLEVIHPHGFYFNDIQAGIQALLEVDINARKDWKWKPIQTMDEQLASMAIREKAKARKLARDAEFLDNGGYGR